MVTRLVDRLLCVCGVPVDLEWSRRTGRVTHPACEPQPAPEPEPEPEPVRQPERVVTDDPPPWWDHLDAAEEAAGDALTPAQLHMAAPREYRPPRRDGEMTWHRDGPLPTLAEARDPADG